MAQTKFGSNWGQRPQSQELVVEINPELRSFYLVIVDATMRSELSQRVNLFGISRVRKPILRANAVY